MKNPLLGIAATLAATIGAPRLVAAQTPRDALVQAPSFAKPERGSLTGALANLTFGAADVSRGAYSLPLPLALPAERGGVLASVVPTYSPDAGITEWGAGWSVGLSIQRYRVQGDVDYATDDFTSPWGRLVAGSDGYFYPSGLASPIRLKQLADGWEAIGPDGTRYEFAQPVDTTDGTYAWYLTTATTIFGDGTAIEYETNASGRPFVKHIYYGGREDPEAYRADFVYAQLATALHDFRSGADLVLDRRVSAVVANVKHRERGSYQERWRYAIAYVDSPFGPGFYLDMLTRTFASGESEPPLSYDYDLGEVQTERGLEFRTSALEPAPVIDSYLQAVGDVDGLQSDRASVLDLEEDGVFELEYVYDYSLASYSPSLGWTLVPLPPATGEVDGLCRPGESVYNGPRTLARLEGSAGPVSVLAVDALWDSTEVIVCNRAGVRQHSMFVEGSWVLGANTKLVDLNRDDKPDLIRLDIDGYHILENVSAGGAVRFAPRRGGILQYEHGMPFEPDATWAHDLNGDGNPDLLGRSADRISVWYGRGRFRFDEQEHAYPFINIDGSELFDLTPWEIAWLDANNDGLTDALLSVHNEAHLFVNEGTHFAEVRAGALEAAWDLGWLVGAPMIGDHQGRGETEVAFSGVDGAYALTLTRPSNGVLVRADDGRGNAVEFEYARSEPHPGSRSRQTLLRSTSIVTSGLDTVVYDYRYGKPTIHKRGRFVIGYERTEQTSLERHEVATFRHDDDMGTVAISSIVTDAQSPGLVEFSFVRHEAAPILGVPSLRPRRRTQGWCERDDPEACASGAAAAVSSSTVFADYDGVCATRTLTTTTQGTLEHIVTLGPVSALTDALHCTSVGDQWSGVHVDSRHDFLYVTSILRDDSGQVIEVKQHGGDGVLTLQQAAYDEVHQRLAWLWSPGTGKQVFTFDDRTGMLKRTAASTGVATSAENRDPVTDAVRELHVERGPGGGLTSSYRYDELERLSKVWSSFGGSSEQEPGQRISYQHATDDYPATVLVSGLVDQVNGARADTVTWAYPDGRSLAEASRFGDKWIVSGVSIHSRAERRVGQYRRRPISTQRPVDGLSYGSLNSETTLLAESKANAFGQQVASWRQVQEGTVSESSQRYYLQGGYLVSEAVDGAGYSTRSGADESGRIVWIEDQVGQVTSAAFDLMGRVTEIVLPSGATHRATYDSYGRLASVVRDRVGGIAYEYDAAGLLERKRHYGTDGELERTVTMSHDSAGRVVSDSHELASDGRVSTFEYGFDGMLANGDVVGGQIGYVTSVTGPDYAFSALRNPDGSIARATVELADWMSVDVQKVYAASGAPVAVRRVATRLVDGVIVDDTSVGYRYDPDGRLVGMTLQGALLASLDYDEEGELSAVDFGSAGRIEYSHDPVTHRVSGYTRQIAAPSSAWASSTEWTYDQRGLVGLETYDIGGRTWDREYGYDARGFLARVSDPDRSATYEYDSDGMPSHSDDQLGARFVSRESVSAAESGEGAYRYDAMGRVIRKGESEFAYGPDGQLETASASGRVASFVYNENGHRVLKRVNGVPVAGYVYDGYLTNEEFIEPIRVGGHLVGIIRGGSFQLISTDSRGTVTADTEGVPTFASAYGARVERSDFSAVLDFVESGYDSDLKAVRMGVRDYDPYLGQFWTPDPLYLEALEGCMGSVVECNLYGYARNNPVSFVDPTGTQARSAEELIAQHAQLQRQYEILDEYIKSSHSELESQRQYYATLYNAYVKELASYYEAERNFKNDQAIDLISRVPDALLQAAGVSVAGALALAGGVAVGGAEATSFVGGEVIGQLSDYLVSYTEAAEIAYDTVTDVLEGDASVGDAFEKFQGLVYRSGTTKVAMAAKPGKDDVVGPNGEPSGISTWLNLESAVPVGRRAAEIDTSLLKCVIAICDNPETGHVTLTTGSEVGDREWAAGGADHWATEDVFNAIVGTVKRLK